MPEVFSPALARPRRGRPYEVPEVPAHLDCQTQVIVLIVILNVLAWALIAALWQATGE